MQLKIDQETSAILKESLDVQVASWQRIKKEIALGLETLAGSQLERSGEQLRSSFGEELRKAHEAQSRVEQAIGYNCTSDVLVSLDESLRTECSSAIWDLGGIQAYVGVLERHNKTISRETEGIDLLFRIAPPVNELINLLVCVYAGFGFGRRLILTSMFSPQHDLYTVDTSSVQHLDIPFHDVLETISHVAERVRNSGVHDMAPQTRPAETTAVLAMPSSRILRLKQISF